MEKRLENRFGSRVKPGGDMYESEKNFLEFVKSRDTKTIEEWLTKLSIPILRLDGTQEISVNVDNIIENYLKMDTKL